MKIINNSIINTANIQKALSILQNPSRILSQKSTTAEIYRAVNEQPDIFSASQNYKDAISAMTISADDAFVQEYIHEFKINEKLPPLTTSARDYGLAVIEIVEYSNFKGKIVPSKFDLSPIEFFHFDTDNNLRLRQPNNPLGIDVQKTYPNKFILLQNEASIRNPYGIALLDIAYWISVGLNGNFEFMMNFAEEDGRDKWVATVMAGASPEHKDNVLIELARLRNNGIAVKEEGSEIEAKDYKGRTSTTNLYKEINDMLLRKVEKLWYGTDLTMQVQGKGGYSSSQTGVDIREDALSKGKKLLTSALESLSTYIANINSTSLKCNFTISSPNEVNKDEAEIDQIYFNMGMKPTEKFFLNRGYQKDEFVLSTPPPNSKQNASFSAPPDNIIDIFDIFKKDLEDDSKKS